MGERQFGPYRLVEQIAVGGMAEIYLAKTRGIAGFEKYVALKMIHPNFSEDEQFIQMLIDEAKITVLLQHVNIAQTFDLGRVGSTYYITMEFVDGADLYKLLRKGSEMDLDVPIDVAAYVTKEVATGLDYAHRKRDVSGAKLNIVHRDVSPQNVLISFNGEVKLVDFGIAKATMRARQTAVGVIKGKYYYMSPEQAWGEPVDHRTDIFSTGILLYEMLTGQMLYLEEDLHKLLDMVRRADVAPPTTLRKDVPPQLERIVMRALAKDRNDRYQTANELATDLERFLHAYSPVFRAPKVSKWVNRVLEDELGPEHEIEPTEPPSQNFRPSITQEQLVRERSEITDENSVIYRLEDLLPPQAGVGRPRGPDEKTGEIDRPQGFPGAKSAGGAAAPLPQLPKLEARALDQETRNVGADVDQLMGFALDPQEGDGGDDDQTVVSDSPFLSAPRGLQDSTKEVDRPGAAARSPSQVGPRTGNGTVESTVVDPKQRFLDNVNTIPDARPDDEEGPTVRRESQGGFLPAKTIADAAPPTERPPPPRNRPRAKTKPPPLPPAAALSASNPAPAVSEVRRPKPSRRTPGEGVPAQSSVLSQLVNQGPGAPVPAGMPVTRPGAEPQPRIGPKTPLAVPIPPGARAAVAPGFDQTHGDATTSPFSPFGNRTPFGQLPPGAPPLSTANQLAALEIDDIPDAFKLSHQAARRRKRAITIAAILCVCVLMGVGMGMFFFRGPAPPTAKTLEVISIPTGASVTVDGREVPGKTPLSVPSVAVGTKYLIGVTYPGHKPWSTETDVTAEGAKVVKVIARLEAMTVKLKVTSEPPGAEVLLNGSPVGQTPLELLDLDPRVTKFVELRLKNYRPIREDLVWDDDTEKALSFTLQK